MELYNNINILSYGLGLKKVEIEKKCLNSLTIALANIMAKKNVTFDKAVSEWIIHLEKLSDVILTKYDYEIYNVLNDDYDKFNLLEFQISLTYLYNKHMMDLLKDSDNFKMKLERYKDLRSLYC